MAWHRRLKRAFHASNRKGAPLVKLEAGDVITAITDAAAHHAPD